MKTIDSVDSLIKKKKAKVYTASEIKEMIRNGNIPEVNDVDVVTTGTFGIMSGTMAVISLPIAEPGSFARAETIELNGVKGIPGPCPNENLGTVDLIIYGTAHRDSRYGGGHLFKDIVSGNTINAEITSEGKRFSRNVTINDMTSARIITTRSAFRNYTAFVNHEKERFDTIFSVTGLQGPLAEASVSGCGEINPLQNDASSYLKEGAPVLMNGARGTILGEGTRSSPLRRNISAAADMKTMDANMMGGFITSAGPECMMSFGAAIPIIDETSLKGVCVLDKDIELPVAEIHTRVPRTNASYGNVWTGTSRMIRTDAKKCLRCEICGAESICPTGAIKIGRIDFDKCVSCGTCLSSCAGHIFSADLGAIKYFDTEIPITLRQSDRVRAELISEKLKEMIKHGNWGLRCF